MTLVVLQSASPTRLPWVDDCLFRTRLWAKRQGYEYRFMGDELFDMVPPWYRRKAADKPPVIADLARLLWIEACLAEGATQAVWVDADCLVVDPTWQVPTGPTLFGEEIWLQRHGNEAKLRLYHNVHNAFCAFTADSPVLAFLIHVVQSLIHRVDPDHIAPQMVGPKLLKTLHGLADFQLVAPAGAISPEVLRGLLKEDDSILEAWRGALKEPLAMVNLCSSLWHTSDPEPKAFIDQPALWRLLRDR
jgi:hypothetical protein